MRKKKERHYIHLEFGDADSLKLSYLEIKGLSVERICLAIHLLENHVQKQIGMVNVQGDAPEVESVKVKDTTERQPYFR